MHIYKRLNDFLYPYSETIKILSLQIPRNLLNLQKSGKLCVVKKTIHNIQENQVFVNN